MAREAGTAMRRRYQGAVRQGRPRARKARPMTVSWPASTPTLKESTAGSSSVRGRPNSERTPAKLSRGISQMGQCAAQRIIKVAEEQLGGRLAKALASCNSIGKLFRGALR